MRRHRFVCAVASLILQLFLPAKAQVVPASDPASSPPLSEEMQQKAMGAATPKLPSYNLRAGCNVSVTYLPVELREIIPVFVARIRDIHEYYMSSPQEGPGLNDRIRARNKAVRSEFKMFEDRRTADYNRYRCQVSKDQTCTSSAGNTKTCRASMNAGNYRMFIRDSIGFSPPIHNGLIRGPAANTNAQTIDFTMRKSGSGRLAVTVKATAKVRPTHTPGLVSSEEVPIRDALKVVNLPDDKAVDP